ncbi:putative phenylacetyl-CoA ligase [Aspergillus pseudoustus]|uniref:Phenylacetyl-CoA ligase n=1 Tax=Aspergillus pseudoustus TaxID=1810923 RepID=A0ABR4K6J6_9EURO
MTAPSGTAVVLSASIWRFLFERPSLPFPHDHVIFRSTATDAQYTYEQVRQRAKQFGRALKSQWGWRGGDVLIVMAPNDIDTPSVIWGCHFSGGVVAPVNPELSAHELHQQLQGSRARGLVVHPQCAAVAVEAARLASLPSDRILILRFDKPTCTYSGLSSIENFINAADEATNVDSRCVEIEPDKDTAFLIYSSGTTGRPKAVKISHRNVVAASALQTAVDSGHIDWRRDRTLAVLPTYHIFGLICLVHLPIYIGTTTMYMDKFEIATFCSLIQEYRISHVYAAPPIVLHLAKNSLVNHYDLRSLRMITSGGAPLPASLVTELHQRRQIPVRQAYGLSETTSVSHIQRWDKWRSSIGSNGPPIPGVEIKFADTDGRQVTVGQEGELYMRGPTIFKGYLAEPGLTAACITPDGWFKTGDIGHEDDKGNMFITDRSKDLIKFKGYQVAPAELEDLILEHEAVKDAAVIGIMDHRLASEVPLAYVVVNSGYPENETTARAVLKHISERTVSYKHLRGGLIFTEDIPKSQSGKILKRVLRDRVPVDLVRRIGAREYARYTVAPKL